MERKEELTNRNRNILQVVVHHYIKTAKPVGSKIIAKDYDFKVSPATIRNVLSDLEKKGYLSHPHTSAGRIPTDRGYRFYVDSLMEVQRLTVDEMDRVQKEYRTKKRELDEIMRRTSHMLSAISNYAGFILTPKVEKSIFKHIEMIPLEEKRLLVVLVTKAGIIKHKIITFQEELDYHIIERISDMLNRKLSGVTFGQLKEKIVKASEEELRDCPGRFESIRRFVRHIVEFYDDEIYVDNSPGIYDVYQDYAMIRAVFETVEEKKRIAEILRHKIKEEGIKILIGRESMCPEMEQCSVVSSTYKSDEHTVGVLGVIGPKRMEYPRMVALVDFVSQFLNRVLNRD